MVTYGLFVEKNVEKMTKVYELLNVLPVYGVKNEKKIEKDVVDWLSEQNEIGQSGEKIVKNFLETKYQAIVEKKPDYIGYDFEVTINNQKLAVEVKTTIRHVNQFYISANELKTAVELNDDYYIYKLNLRENGGKLFIIKNPVNLLDIDPILLETILENQKISAKMDGLVITLKDALIKELPVIDIHVT